MFAVHQGYWELVFRIQDLAAKRQSQTLAEDFLAENTVRVELGTLAPIELVQAETRVKTREGDVIVAEAALREADDKLKTILNIPENMGSWSVRLQPDDSLFDAAVDVLFDLLGRGTRIRHRNDCPPRFEFRVILDNELKT